MVLIISEESDISTKRVIDWLLFFKIQFIIINEQDCINNLTIDISDTKLDFTIHCNNNKEFKFSEITTYWYRRGMFNIPIPQLTGEKLKKSKIQHLSSELGALQFFLHYLIEKKEGIGCFYDSIYFDKIKQLVIAKEVGLNIPSTKISNNKEELNTFFELNKICITKNIHREFSSTEKNAQIWTTGTHIIKDNNLEILGINPTFPCFIQKAIIKKYELRIFYLNEKIWSMCIFHQLSEKDINKISSNDIDYRSIRELRMVPYSLPTLIEDKIILLMNKLNLNTGSIDLLVSNDMKYYFLEVNPVGQYDFVSVLCNFSLDKEIALRLRELHKKYTT